MKDIDEEKTAFNARAKESMRAFLLSKTWEEKVESIARMNAAMKIARESMRKAKAMERTNAMPSDSTPPGKTIPGGDQFPYLAQLLSGYFHQDYMLDSEDFEVVVKGYSEHARKEEKAATAQEIGQFIERYGTTDEALREAMDRVFSPCVIVEGWNGLTTRQWLLRVAVLLSDRQ